MSNKKYLGDSVYAERSDALDSIILTTENGLPDDPSNKIYIDYQVWRELVAYVKANTISD